MSDEDDLDLLERWRGGDKRAGNRLFGRYFKSIRAFFATRYPEVYEDLLQQTFMALSKSPDAFRGDSSFRTYLFKIARHIGYAHLRDKYRAQSFDEYRSSIAILTGREQSGILARREDHRLLLDALGRLPVAKQELLEMYYWQDLTGPEIAGVFVIPEGTVRGRIRLALEELTKIFEELQGQPHSRELEADEIDRMMAALRAEVVESVAVRPPTS
jgi:RNA polymerase sigma-70 factor (ECF subfamily)